MCVGVKKVDSKSFAYLDLCLRTVALKTLPSRRLSCRVHMHEDDFVLIVVVARVFASDQKVWVRIERIRDRLVLFDCVVCR